MAPTSENADPSERREGTEQLKVFSTGKQLSQEFFPPVQLPSQTETTIAVVEGGQTPSGAGSRTWQHIPWCWFAGMQST